MYKKINEIFARFHEVRCEMPEENINGLFIFIDDKTKIEKVREDVLDFMSHHMTCSTVTQYDKAFVVTDDLENDTYTVFVGSYNDVPIGLNGYVIHYQA